MLVDSLAAIALVTWLGILLLPSGPWRTRERLTPVISNDVRPAAADLRSVSVLIPARNEAAAIAGTLGGLTEQGENLEVFLVDDQSDDGTRNAALVANSEFTRPLDLSVIEGKDLPDGWGGKLWALEQGLSRVDREFCLLIDAEIVLAPGVLRTLLEKAKSENLAMVSVMAKLRSENFWEKLLVPPFIFFFKLLYPFASVNEPSRRAAAAAGGCILIRTAVLRSIGGFAAIRDALIDDCMLAARVKHSGHSIWLGLSDSVTSSRAYRSLADFRRMVTRTAFTQLRFSALLLVLVVVIMSVLFIAPFPALAWSSEAWGRAAGAASIAVMSAVYWPTIRFYRLSPVWVLTLPLAAVLFLAMTVESAWQFWRGVTARWKGRAYTFRS